MADQPTDGKPAITYSANGPLIVKGLRTLRNSRGETIQVKATIALCRCGGSANKPFCDGTHARIGFSGENTADRGAEREERYEGPELTILDNRFVCAHIGACTERLAEVFRYGEEPWIVPDGADAERIREVVAGCPSGALAHALRGESAPAAEPRREAAITVGKDGPYYAQGDIALETDAWGQRFTRQRYALCRCGQSRNKPFCDGSHWEAGFSDEKN